MIKLVIIFFNQKFINIAAQKILEAFLIYQTLAELLTSDVKVYSTESLLIKTEYSVALEDGSFLKNIVSVILIRMKPNDTFVTCLFKGNLDENHFYRLFLELK